MIVFEKTNWCSNFEVLNYLRHLTDALLKTQMRISFWLYPLTKLGMALHQNQMPDIQIDLKGKFSLYWEPEGKVWVT